MSEFTKGKWKVVQGAGVDEFDVISEDAPLHNCICVLFGYPTSRWEEQKANARLIAAAPELYEALDALLDELPIIAGDSRHDALVLAMHEAQKLLARIDGEEVNHDEMVHS